jgi:hypothetical protein
MNSCAAAVHPLVTRKIVTQMDSGTPVVAQAIRRCAKVFHQCREAYVMPQPTSLGLEGSGRSTWITPVFEHISDTQALTSRVILPARFSLWVTSDRGDCMGSPSTNPNPVLVSSFPGAGLCSTRRLAGLKKLLSKWPPSVLFLQSKSVVKPRACGSPFHVNEHAERCRISGIIPPILVCPALF